MDVDTPGLGIDIIDQAVESWRADTNQGPYSPPLPPGGSEPCYYTGRIVSVGRRSDVPMFPER